MNNGKNYLIVGGNCVPTCAQVQHVKNNPNLLVFANG